MGLIKPDLSEVKDSVTPGSYKVRVVDAKIDMWEGKNGKPDTHFVNWTLETFGESEDKNNGRKIFHRTPTNGGGAFRLKDFYRAAMGEDLGAEFDTDMLLGKELQITVVDGKDKEGQPTGYTEVKTVRAL